jgi:hypothetical protein
VRAEPVHLCDRDGAEVNLVLESGDGRVVGVEVEGKPWIRTEVSSTTQVEMSPVAASSGSGLFHRSGDCSRLIKRKITPSAVLTCIFAGQARA